MSNQQIKKIKFHLIFLAFLNLLLCFSISEQHFIILILYAFSNKKNLQLKLSNTGALFSVIT